MLLFHMPLGVQLPPGQLPLVVEWGIEVEDQTQLTASPTLIVWVAGTNDIELFGPTWTVIVVAVTGRNRPCAVALTCQESSKMIEAASARIGRGRLIIT